MAENYAVITGNPLDGLRLVGPFATADEATQYAEVTAYTTITPVGVAEMQPPMREGSADTHFTMESNHPLDAPAMACWLLHAQIPFECVPRWRSEDLSATTIYQFKIPRQYEEQVTKFNDGLLE